MNEKVNLAAKLACFDETWSPKVVGELNGQYVKVVKFVGEYVWHQHETEDELFLVLKGAMQLHLRDRVVDLREGEFFIVEHGVEHKPVAKTMCHALLFEPATTRNTGEVEHEYTIEAEDLEHI
ncbi:MAG: cupin domain-containing protein [Phycisphaerales bacterium]|nr:MAG: cupin domain-containing protein [Phycisphaerales bacterium]